MTKVYKPFKINRVEKKPMLASTKIFEKNSVPVRKEGALLYVPESCTESVNTICGVCPKMIVTPTTHGGCDCTQSKCKLGHWKGNEHWNWLWKEPEPFVPMRKHRRKDDIFKNKSQTPHECVA